MRCRTYFLVAVDDGVPGVVAALAADDDLRRAGEHVDDFALAFVTPLRPYENDVGHTRNGNHGGRMENGLPRLTRTREFASQFCRRVPEAGRAVNSRVAAVAGSDFVLC